MPISIFFASILIVAVLGFILQHRSISQCSSAWRNASNDVLNGDHEVSVDFSIAIMDWGLELDFNIAALSITRGCLGTVVIGD